jgi:hypothetical protein
MTAGTLTANFTGKLSSPSGSVKYPTRERLTWGRGAGSEETEPREADIATARARTAATADVRGKTKNRHQRRKKQEGVNRQIVTSEVIRLHRKSTFLTSKKMTTPEKKTNRHTDCPACKFPLLFRHAKWVYFAVDGQSNRSIESLLAVNSRHYIGLATFFEERNKMNNREKGYKTGAKSTNLKSGEKWDIELVVGPFYDKGREFKEAWRTTKRGTFNRYQHVVKQCKEWNQNKNIEDWNTARSVDSESVLKWMNETSLTQGIKEKLHNLATRPGDKLGILCRSVTTSQKIFAMKQHPHKMTTLSNNNSENKRNTD